MVCEIVGKSSVFASKKTGKDGYWMQVLYARPGWEGRVGEQVYLYPENYPPALFKVGGKCAIEHDSFGRVIDCQPLDD